MNASKLYCGTILVIAGLAVFCVRHVSAVWLAIEQGFSDRATGGFEVIQRIIGVPLLVVGTLSILLGLVLIAVALWSARGGNR